MTSPKNMTPNGMHAPVAIAAKKPKYCWHFSPLVARLTSFE